MHLLRDGTAMMGLNAEDTIFILVMIALAYHVIRASI